MTRCTNQTTHVVGVVNFDLGGLFLCFHGANGMCRLITNSKESHVPAFILFYIVLHLLCNATAAKSGKVDPPLG